MDDRECKAREHLLLVHGGVPASFANAHRPAQIIEEALRNCKLLRDRVLEDGRRVESVVCRRVHDRSLATIGPKRKKYVEHNTDSNLQLVTIGIFRFELRFLFLLTLR